MSAFDRNLFDAMSSVRTRKTAEDLETLGKAAATRFLEGRERSLTDAVVGVVKAAGDLTGEQARRVVEAANVDAFRREHVKEGGRYVDFHGGPADPSAVLQELGSRSVDSIPDPHTHDYAAPPPREKRAAEADDALDRVFARTGAAEIPHLQPFSELNNLRLKLAGALDHITSDLTGAQREVRETFEVLAGEVKQAVADGVSLHDVVRAWHAGGATADAVKVAFTYLPFRGEDGADRRAFLDSLEKRGGHPGYVNLDHPLVTSFTAFSGALDRAAALQGAREELAKTASAAESFLNHAEIALLEKRANAAEAVVKSKGLLRRIADAAESAAGPVAKGVRAAGEFVHGPDSAVVDAASRAAHAVVRKSPHIVGGLAAVNLAQRASELGDHPVGQFIVEHVPGTAANRRASEQRRLEYQTGFGGGYTGGYGY